MLLNHLIIGVIVSSFSVMVILTMKKVFQNHLAAKWSYNIWYFLMILLSLPFFPSHTFKFDQLFWGNSQGNASVSSFAHNGNQVTNSFNWVQDFSVSVNRTDISFVSYALVAIWIVGVLITSFMTFHAWLSIHKIKRNSIVIRDEKYLLLFEECRIRLGISKPIKLTLSSLVSSPMTFGLFQTYVVLPKRSEAWLTMKEMEYIFLHELNHYKNRDILVNYVMVFYQIIYWFNPLIWIAFREMRLDREIACDTAVLKSLDTCSHADYGNTIINFIDRTIRKRTFSFATELNGSKEQIKKRIERIANFAPESMEIKWRSILIFGLVGLLVSLQLPFVSAFADENQRYDFASKNIVYEDLGKYFDGFEGSFVLFDEKNDQYFIHNKERSTLRVSPDSTYKIYSGLFALESNVITADSSIISWDGAPNPYESWNTDHDLASALENSVNWYFQALDKQTGLDTIQASLNQINYGNGDVSGGVDSFWLESTLKISPVEQVKILRDFYHNDQGFKQEHINTVKDALQLEEKNGAILSGKTGTGNVNGKNINGWFIGYVEAKDNTYYFATNIQDETDATGSKAVEIALSILKKKNLY
ncbi:BlaR1 family beta-lactam sensor/signal transducer [Robertmurraya kyonggiensis]|uniref:BlaR1 family beta-lactam sensor/signal transducer n=2 Tax=Robertmurraya kyonggiensis TaxID=1037680 RepID=A0A4U1DDB1_9BACI|nr:BlaR1 family beta-lactam sensor/signal transducer [Robertmurraya kyonggiensis]